MDAPRSIFSTLISLILEFRLFLLFLLVYDFSLDNSAEDVDSLLLLAFSDSSSIADARSPDTGTVSYFDKGCAELNLESVFSVGWSSLV